MTSLPVDVPSVAARLARLEERLAALEAAVGMIVGSHVDPKPTEDELSRLEWAVKHGRQRPW